ncbi:PTS sugar transporter subunit IIA [Paraherbaspirillum soli]|uniref:PTS sugar transporter subunit IIA n=1 Tax=Paraherbaspirillum soli TaxID=631222 RepID=A0ABW0MBN7_9BURK
MKTRIVFRPRLINIGPSPSWKINAMRVAKLLQPDFLMSPFAKFLFPENIRLDVAAFDKTQAFAQVAAVFEREHRIGYSQVYEGLRAREQLDSTGLGCGVALPHAQISGLRAPMMAFVRLRMPIGFDAPDGLPVSDLLVLLVPGKGSQEYLQLLAEIAGVLCDASFREQLCTAHDPYAVWQLFVRWRRSHAH